MSALADYLLLGLASLLLVWQTEQTHQRVTGEFRKRWKCVARPEGGQSHSPQKQGDII